MKGCDKFCTFCVVPFTRGREVSRPAEDILDEVDPLGAGRGEGSHAPGPEREFLWLLSGSRKRQLASQFQIAGLALSNGPFLSQLLRQVGAVPGIQRVRFMTSHPLDLSDELVEVMASTPSVCESIHLPVQCGSDKVLKRMNRKYSVAHYLERVGNFALPSRNCSSPPTSSSGFPARRKRISRAPWTFWTRCDTTWSIVSNIPLG